MDYIHPVFYFFFFILLIILTYPILNKLTHASWFTDKNRNRKLEGLRGLLAPTVFFHHAIITFYFFETDQWKAPPSAFYNKLGPGPVLLFFFMTGFLFWNQVLSTSKPFNFLEFIKKRSRRLMPAYYMSFVLILFIIFYLSNWEVKTEPTSLIQSLLTWIAFGFPFSEFRPINNFASTIYINAAVAWSLYFEWIFYLLFGFLRRFSTLKKYLLLMLGLELFKRVLDNLHQTSQLYQIFKDVYYFLILGFNFGIFASFLNHSTLKSYVSTKPMRVLGVVSVATYLFVDQIPAYGLLGSCFLFVFFISVVLDTSEKHFFHWKGFQILGHISYSVYLLHGIGLYVGFHTLNKYQKVTELSPVSFWFYTYLIGVVILIASLISYKYVEYPFMKSRKPA